MAECSQLGFELPGLNGRKIEGNFQGGNVSSDAGLMLLRQVDRRLGLTKALTKRLPDGQDPDKIEHSLESMLRQRIYGLALGYEDLNDHDVLRKDLLWQSAAERSEELASCSTLCRLENRAGRKEAWLMHQVLFEQFVNSFESAPSELILGCLRSCGQV
jgi:DDE family transposase